MAEDIDDLLEEVETKFLTKDKKQSRSKSNRKEKRLVFYWVLYYSLSILLQKKEIKTLWIINYSALVVYLSLLWNVTFSFFHNLDHVW